MVSVFGFGRSKSHFRAPENRHFWHIQVPENGTSSGRIEKRRPLFHANIPPKWWIWHLFHVFTTFGWEINKFWILHIFTSFSHEHGPFFSKWWPSQENAKKIIFFAEMAYIHVGTKYIKRPWDFENFLEFWCTLMYIWNFSTDPPTQKMKHMFHMIILCCTFHKTQKDDDGGDGDIIWQEKALFQKVCYEGCLIGSIDWFRGIFATEMHRDASHL